MAVTIKDIAKVANVSHTTVSRALRDHPAIASETTTRIQKLAKELGYVPNTVARGLKTNRSRVLGVITRRITDPFFTEVLDGIENVLQAAGYSLFLAASNLDAQREEEIVRAMSERRVDGVIISSSQVGQHHRQQLERFGVASVLINNAASEHLANSVSHDDIDGSRQITRHLLELGHRRIAYLSNARAGRVKDDRLAGFREEMARAGLPSDWVVEGPNGLPEGGRLGVTQLLALAERPTAVVCYNDMMAIGVTQTFQRHGIRVPQDCSITGFDNVDLAAYVTPPLTTFDQPKYQLGQEAAWMMLRLLEDDYALAKGSQATIIQLRGKLCLRQSTAPCPV